MAAAVDRNHLAAAAVASARRSPSAMAGCNVGGNSSNAYGTNPQKGFVPSKWGTLDSPEKSNATSAAAPHGRGPVVGVKSFDVQAQPMFSSASNANQAVQGDKAEHNLPMVKRGPNSGELPAADESSIPADAPPEDTPADPAAHPIPAEPSKTSATEKDSVHLVSAELEVPTGEATEVSTVAIDGRKSSTVEATDRTSTSATAEGGASGVSGSASRQESEATLKSPSETQDTAARRQTSLVKKDRAASGDGEVAKVGGGEDDAHAAVSTTSGPADQASGGEGEKVEAEGLAKSEEQEKFEDAASSGDEKPAEEMEKAGACRKGQGEGDVGGSGSGGGDEDELQEEVLSD